MVKEMLFFSEGKEIFAAKGRSGGGNEEERMHFCSV